MLLLYIVLPRSSLSWPTYPTKSYFLGVEAMMYEIESRDEQTSPKRDFFALL